MSLVRQVILPTVIATPIWLWSLAVPHRGLEALAEFDLGLGDLVFGVVFTMIGVLLIGLPAASFFARKEFPAGVKAALLLLIGAIGGSLVASFYVLSLAMLGGGMISETVAAILSIAQFGLLPGSIVALTWTLINFDQLRNPLRERRHA